MNGVTLVTLSLLLAFAAEPDTDSKKPTTITKPKKSDTKSAPQRPKNPHPGVVRAMGIGKPPRRMAGARAKLMARRAAEVRAVRNLVIKLGYGRRAVIRGFRYVSTEYLVDGSVRVIVEEATKGLTATEEEARSDGATKGRGEATKRRSDEGKKRRLTADG